MVERAGEIIIIKGKPEDQVDHNHNHHHGGGAAGRALKKGPWTAAEDGILIEYVKKHGEGNWNAVQKHTGLARCGKSCRLRWANHLRPNLKKGSFSQDEERVIIELHAKLGNKWARMAAQLPGRTDNEIKNYWNTRMKRRQRAGLPLYPLEIQQEATAAFHLRQQPHHHHHSSAGAAGATYSALRHKPDFNNINNPNSFSIFNFSSTINNPHKNFSDGSSFYPTPINQFKIFSDTNTGNGFSVPLSPVSPFPQIGQPPMNQPLSSPPPPPSQGGFQLSYGNYLCNSNSGLNSMILEAPYPHLIPGLETELPSIQTPPQSATPASSASGGDGIMAPTNSGLLDVVLMEAEARSRNEKQSREEISSSAGGGELKAVLGDGGGAAGENHSDEFSSSGSSPRKRLKMEPQEMDSMDDDDLMSLLSNFPSGLPVPEWYPGIGNDDLGISTHNGPSLGESNGDPKLSEQRPRAASPSRVASPVLEWSLGSSCWNNIPSIY